MPSTFEEWLDRLFSRALSEYGQFGRCTATAKTTGERCRQSATGNHRKYYYHGGAPRSGIGEGQRDHAVEYMDELLENIEERRREASERTQALLDNFDNHNRNTGSRVRPTRPET